MVSKKYSCLISIIKEVVENVLEFFNNYSDDSLSIRQINNFIINAYKKYALSYNINESSVRSYCTRGIDINSKQLLDDIIIILTQKKCNYILNKIISRANIDDINYVTRELNIIYNLI